jgi:molecular chaperone GrpE
VFLPVLLTEELSFVQVHEAIMQEESTEYAEGIVVQEFRKGFKIGDSLLRPAMVKVSSGPGPASKKSG